MRLDRLFIDGWRGFEESELVFADGACTVLSGLNNSGKSALLDAIWLVLTTTPPDGPGHISALFLVEGEKEGLPPVGSRDLARQMVDDHVKGLLQSVGSDNETMVVVDPRTPMLRSRSARRGARSLGPDLLAVPIQQGEEPGLMIQGRAVTSFSNVPSISIELWNQMRSALSSLKAYRLPTIRPGAPEEMPAEATEDLRPSGGNLPHVLLWLQTRDGDAWRRIRDLFETVYPDAGRLLAMVSKAQVSAVLHDPTSGRETNLKHAGSGLEQFLLVAIACEQSEPGTIVLVDEPEIGLHPTALRALAVQLSEWARSVGVVVATHSPLLVSELDRTGVINVVERVGGRASITKAPEHIQAHLADLGVRPSDALGYARFLVVEGPSDRDVIEEWFGPELKSAGVGVIAAEGGTRVGAVAKIADELSGEFGEKVWTIVDGDEGASRPPRERELVLPCHEIENAFLEQAETVARFLLEQHGIGASPSDVDDAIEAAVAELKDETIWLAVTARLRPGIQSAALRLQRKGSTVSGNVDGVMDLLERGAASLPSREVVEGLWRNVSAEVEEQWPDGRRFLVPGAEALSATLRRLTSGDHSYKKTRDAPFLARSVGEDPTNEVRESIRAFLAEKVSVLPGAPY